MKIQRDSKTKRWQHKAINIRNTKERQTKKNTNQKQTGKIKNCARQEERPEHQPKRQTYLPRKNRLARRRLFLYNIHLEMVCFGHGVDSGLRVNTYRIVTLIQRLAVDQDFAQVEAVFLEFRDAADFDVFRLNGSGAKVNAPFRFQLGGRKHFRPVRSVF